MSATSNGSSIVSFVTVTDGPIGIVSASFSFVFPLTKLSKSTRNKKRKHNKNLMLSRSKLNSIESKISETLIDNEISHDYFTTIINEEKNYCELKEIKRTMKSQRSDTDTNNLIEEGKRMGVSKIIRQNNLKTQV